MSSPYYVSVDMCFLNDDKRQDIRLILLLGPISFNTLAYAHCIEAVRYTPASKSIAPSDRQCAYRDVDLELETRLHAYEWTSRYNTRYTALPLYAYLVHLPVT
jgi:hypothetical protein